MTSTLCRVAFAVLFATVVPFSVLAGEDEGVTVRAPKLQETLVGRSTTGAFVYDVSATRVVNSSDLDLATEDGLALLRVRVRDAAADACDEIERFYPNAQPGKYQCVKLATQRTMREVRELVAAR
jgi:UrcA family protein